MNFIKETDRFARDLENWKKGHGYTNLEGLKDLMDIWHTFINLPERKAVTYPNVTAHIPLVDYKCGKCGPLTDALTLIYAWRNSKELQNEVYVDFTGIDKAEIVEKIEEPLVEFKGIPIDYGKLKMHELRSIAKKNPNLEFSNKTTKEELIRLINS